MNCQNCGFTNDSTSKFCMKCGNPLEIRMGQQTVQTTAQSTQNHSISNGTNGNVGQPMYQQGPMQQPIQNPTINEFANVNTQSQVVEPRSQKSTQPLNYLFFIIAVILKPVTAIKEELHKFEDTKNSVIFASLIAGVTTILGLIKTMFSVVYIPASPGFMGYGATEAQWVWENLKKLKWGEIILKNFLLYLGILLAIALIYYLASVILKKHANFKRLLGIASLSLIPYIILSMIVSPLASKLWSELGLIIMVAGILYTILLLIYGLNREIDLDDNDMKIYVNLICLSILCCAIYFVFTKLFLNAKGPGNLNGLLDLFG